MTDDKKLILYVDDDQDALDAVRVMLESAGYAMLEARTAEQGLRLCRAHAPGLVLVDLMMEEIDAGTAFVTALRATGNATPVYMLSSVGDTLSVSMDAGALGLAGVFQKPVDRAALLAVVQATLEAAER